MHKQSDGSSDHTPATSIEQLHRAACERGELSYKDPHTGYLVFTALGLKRQGGCCGSACRHCPYEHQAVGS